MANILIVEDEKNMQEIIVEYFHRGGHILSLIHISEPTRP